MLPLCCTPRPCLCRALARCPPLLSTALATPLIPPAFPSPLPPPPAQYCGQRFPTHDLTFDHVVPRCQGGRSDWQNVVAACVGCNHRKGGRTLAQLRRAGEMGLRRPPVQPSNAQLQGTARRYPPRFCHTTWRDYLYWDTQLTD